MKVAGNTECQNFDDLSAAEVEQRRAQEGFNEIPRTERSSWLALFLNVVREPMVLLLIVCGALYMVLGDVKEAGVLIASVFIITGISLRQERRTSRALEALRDLASPRALVIRDGEKVRIAGREVVRGDILLVAEGDRVAADAELVSALNLSVDESMLTGESVPVLKMPASADQAVSAKIFSGTLVVKGQGIARVIATGPRTEMGRLGKMLEILAPEPSLLQKQTRVLVRRFAVVGLALCILLAVTYGFLRHDWLNGLLAGLSLAMSMMPEEFPLVMTIFMAMGAWRLSRQNVLTRKMPVIETLGAATVLCVDKTGTITQNRMTVAALCVHGQDLKLSSNPASLPEEFHEVVEYSILASPADPFDPMEKAMQDLGRRTLTGTEHLHADWQLLREYPLSGELLAMSRVWKSRESSRYVIAAKGAPEAILDLCHLPMHETQRLQDDVARLSKQGLRVMGVARASFSGESLPQGQHDFDFEFIGFLGLVDPIRPEVPAAVAECQRAGVRLIMMTGDHAGTAQSIARQAGLLRPEDVLMGPDILHLDDAELLQKLKQVSVCARTQPEHKLRIVQLLQKQGEVVAMTGDGVNDAPALKAADIGIAMGARGTDVAREAATLVLLDDNFASIVSALRAGRLIYENLRKAMLYIFSVHIPIAGLALFPVLMGLPLALLPVHILFLEMIIDPACSLVFEGEAQREDLMARPPRPRHQAVLDRRRVGLGFAAGMAVMIFVVSTYSLAIQDGRAETAARALSFVMLVAGNLMLILFSRASGGSLRATLLVPNRVFIAVTCGASFFLALTIFVPILSRFFYFASLIARDAGTVLMELIFLAGVLAILNRLNRRPARVVPLP